MQCWRKMRAFCIVRVFGLNKIGYKIKEKTQLYTICVFMKYLYLWNHEMMKEKRWQDGLSELWKSAEAG